MGRHASGKRRSRLADSRGVGTAVDDLRLLAAKRWLQLEALGAVAVIFGLYFGILAVIRSNGSWLLFLLVPAGLSGFVVGALLDRAHSAASRSAPPALSSDSVVVEFREPADPPGDTASDAETSEPEPGEQSQAS